MLEDPAREARAEVLIALHEWRGSKTFTVAEIGQLQEGQPVPRAFDGALRDGWNVRAAGKLLARYNGQWTDDLTLRRAGTDHQAVAWRVEKRTEQEAQFAMLIPERDPYGYAIPSGGEGQK